MSKFRIELGIFRLSSLHFLQNIYHIPKNMHENLENRAIEILFDEIYDEKRRFFTQKFTLNKGFSGHRQYSFHEICIFSKNRARKLEIR